jgi:hypothetical protein
VLRGEELVIINHSEVAFVLAVLSWTIRGTLASLEECGTAAALGNIATVLESVSSSLKARSTFTDLPNHSVAHR